MVATAKRKAERAKAFAEAQAKATKQKANNTSKKNPKASSSNILSTNSSNNPSAEEQDGRAANAEKPEHKDRKHRFIVFIGNLPYTATTAQIKEHFASVSPSHIRHSTDKSTGKSKGFAFLEFDEYSRMEICIKTFHHSYFGATGSAAERKDGDRTKLSLEEKKAGGRRINVELTVGGGGSKSTARLSKLKAKNKKLTEERKKRASAGGGSSGKAKDEEKHEVAEEDNHIHPSRRFKVAT